MLAQTHICFSLLFSIITYPYLTLFNIQITFLLYAIILVISSLLPDIDCATAKLGKRIKIISYVFEHRGIFHSIWPLIVMFFLIFNQANEFMVSVIIAVMVGYTSHLLLDMLTPQGIRLLYPSKLKIRWFIDVGSFIEKIICIILLITDIALLLF